MFLRALGVFTGRGRRIPSKGFTQLTSKTGPKGYYKGKGVPTVGHHTRKGGYKILQDRLPQYVVPDLTDFKLKPYIAYETKPSVSS
ncbi:g920 [Coccomyxa viridis]|uniref:G920 protein n=1 Tax=Coccomyxa viridis TaxID=1274662 RepID=A0ABP1FGT6_9CHLO